MLECSKTVAFVFATCLGTNFLLQGAFARIIPESPSALNNEDYSESQEHNLMDKNSDHLPRDIFSGGNGIFNKVHPQMEDIEENRLAFELQKRVSTLVDESQRRRMRDLVEGMPKLFLLPNKDGFPKYFRLQPYAWRSRSGNLKAFASDKRPVNKKYYSEPEGSEFLGGPGKR